MHSKAPAHPEVTEFETTVDRVVDGAVVLSETFFYPEGGGQPADRGTIEGESVIHVGTVDGEVRHHLVAETSIEPGEVVRAEIDRPFRTYCRRAHTASHALYGAARQLFDDLDYGGFGISETKIRVDLNTPSTVDDGRLVELERLVNRAIWESRPVTWEKRPREAALSDESVAVTTTGVVADASSVRVVEIEGWDRAVCGGTHVRNTRQIGPVTVLDRSNPGEGLTRVEFAVGPRAIDRRAEDHRAAREAARTLDAPIADLPAAVRRLREDREKLAGQAEELREQVIEARLSDLTEATVERDGREWLAGSVPSDDASALAEFAGRLVERTASVVALVGADGSTVAVATDGTVDARTVVDGVTGTFGGGGGGSETLAQAGGMRADPDDLVAYLRGVG